MPATTTITNDPLLFDKLLAPIEAALQRLDAEPRSQAAKKLGFRLFVRVLLFRLFAQIKSLGLLVLDLRTTTAARARGLPRLGLSTLHDAFARYPHAWLVQLTQAVLAEGVLTRIPELAAFGPLWCVDSSWWPRVAPTRLVATRRVSGRALAFGVVAQSSVSSGLSVEL